MKARHRSSSRRVRALVGLGVALGSSAGLVGLTAAPASADVTRCVGAVQTPGAFACYSSPRWDHSGFDKTTVAEFPVVCYAISCTTGEFHIFTPNDDVSGRFTSVFYLNHTYTVYRPAASQPYIVTSDNPRLDDATSLQVLALSMALDAENSV